MPEVPLADREPGIAGDTTPWIEKSAETMKDGSEVTVSEVRYGHRVSMKARRVRRPDSPSPTDRRATRKP